MKLQIIATVLLPLVALFDVRQIHATTGAPSDAESYWSSGDEEITDQVAENNETISEELPVQWDIDVPEISIKKSGNIKRGKVIEKIVLTRQLKQAIVAAHNRARSITIPSASNMLKMTWDKDLEKTALTYSRKCIYEHNPDPKHTRFAHVGENLFISMGLPYNKKLLEHAVKAWDEEKTVYNYSTVTCKKGKVCGHYTQVVWAETFKVGCGVTKCGNINVRGRNWKNAILFNCNYGPGGNYAGEKPYQRGTKCKKCHKSDRCAGKLCSNNIRDRLVFNPNIAKWSDWSKWSKCSVTCGMGSQRRERTCNTFVQTDCPGYGSEVKFCMNKPCSTNQSSFTYDIVLQDGDNFDANSLLNLFMGKGKK